MGLFLIAVEKLSSELARATLSEELRLCSSTPSMPHGGADGHRRCLGTCIAPRTGRRRAHPSSSPSPSFCRCACAACPWNKRQEEFGRGNTHRDENTETRLADKTHAYTTGPSGDARSRTTPPASEFCVAVESTTPSSSYRWWGRGGRAANSITWGEVGRGSYRADAEMG